MCDTEHSTLKYEKTNGDLRSVQDISFTRAGCEQSVPVSLLRIKGL